MQSCPPSAQDESYSFDDIPDKATTSGIATEMELSPGDVFEWDDKPHKVVTIDDRHALGDRDSMKVTNPLVSHPQHAEAGDWGTPIGRLYAAWRRGDAQPASLTLLPAMDSDRDVATVVLAPGVEHGGIQSLIEGIEKVPGLACVCNEDGTYQVLDCQETAPEASQ